MKASVAKGNHKRIRTLFMLRYIADEELGFESAPCRFEASCDLLNMQQTPRTETCRPTSELLLPLLGFNPKTETV